MRIDEIVASKGKHKQSHRVGRGSGSNRGNTSGRGSKGQKARTGGNIPARFEGGQTPLSQRIPKRKGFKNPKRTKIFVINLCHLNNFLEKDKLTIASLQDKGYFRKGEEVKILGSNTLQKAVGVETHRISTSAQKQIEAAGGKVIIISTEKKSASKK